MTRDHITEITKKDLLIKELGKSWLRRNLGNPKAKQYASQHMCMSSRLLINLRTFDTNKEKCLWHFLVANKFEQIIIASLNLALPYMDDIEEMKSPSNCIKVKYDILHLLDFKWYTVTSSKELDKKEAKECDNIKRCMTIHWAERVTKMARTVLITRTFNKEICIPSANDVMTLTKKVRIEIDQLNLKELSEKTYRRAVQLIQTRLLLYNKRRSGEIDNIR